MATETNCGLSAGSPVLFPARTKSDSQSLALAFLRYASACWRGEACAQQFAKRLARCWRQQLPPIPAKAADAFSPHGGGGRGINWYETGDDVLGVIPGSSAGYQVPRRSITGFLDCVSASAWSAAAGMAPGCWPESAALAVRDEAA